MAGLIWGLIGVWIALASEPSDLQATLGVLMIAQAVSGVIAWRRLRATAEAVLPDFLTVYLLIQFVSKSITALGRAAEIYSDPLQFMDQRIASMYQIVPAQYEFQAELLFLLAMGIFIATWRMLEGRRPLAVWTELSSSSMWWVYLVGLCGYLLVSVGGRAASLGIAAELLRLLSIGAIAVLLGGRTKYALGARRGLVAVLALAPWYLLALRSGMKGEFALVSLPMLLPALRSPSVGRSILVAGFLAIVVVFVFPFSQEWRMANWGPNRIGDEVEVHSVASRVLLRWEEDGLLETAKRSTQQWTSRGSSSEQGGLVMYLAEQDGLIGPILLTGFASMFIPRAIWPDKPTYAPGAWFSWYLGYAPTPEDATTSTAMMLPTELYWMFGILGVVLGMPLLAILYFWTWRFLVRRATTGPIAAAALFALLARSAGLEGVHAIYAFSSPIMLVVAVLVVDRIQRIALPRAGISR